MKKIIPFLVGYVVLAATFSAWAATKRPAVIPKQKTKVVKTTKSQSKSTPQPIFTPQPAAGPTPVAATPPPTPVSQPPVTAPSQPIYKSLGLAPELTGITRWLNSEPLTIAGLRGKVVLVHFWTFACINCIHTLPYVTKWYDTYKDKGLVVLGVHTPELAYERVTDNLINAIKQYNIHYPVAQDNDFATWNAYYNSYWPAYYLIDQQGNVIYTHAGEGSYDEMEKIIRQLLQIN
ncbi:thioredoxin family protein [Candidatus Uhrbacteria bacterium]|nr:thioredoxin family protein [Candidatus Uhrbacteria bacterium]